MPAFPSVFPLWWIALTAIIAGSVGFILLRWRFKELPIRERALAALIVALCVLAWRSSANIPQFNDDPIALLSPNDWLCPVITYIFLGVYAAFRPAVSALRGWSQVRAWLTVITLVVNVIVI